MSDTRKKKAQDIMDAIRGVLNRDWDPLDVFQVEIEDEYDRYIAPIYRLLTTDSSREIIARELMRIEHEEIGLVPGREEALLPIADKLLTIDIRMGG